MSMCHPSSIRFCTVIVGLLCAAVCFHVVPSAAAASQGPLSPSTLANDSSFGNTPWTNPDNAGASDNVYASLTIITPNSYYLKATNFGFSIPNGATINGILAHVERLDQAGSGCEDARVRIVKNAVIGATEKSGFALWGNAEVIVPYGSSTDLWGETWTATDINSSNFGFVIAADAVAFQCTGYIDSIKITVHYTDGGGTSASQSGGDGNPIWLQRLRERNAFNARRLGTGTLVLDSYVDFSGDGIRQLGERLGFAGLPVSVDGVDVGGNRVHIAGIIGSGGHVTLGLPPSNSSGYLIKADMNSPSGTGYILTSGPDSFVISAGNETKGTMAFRPVWTLPFNGKSSAPCMTIAAARKDERSATYAEVLLQRLVDAELRPIDRDIDWTRPLVLRGDAFRLLSRAFCVSTNDTTVPKSLEILDRLSGDDSKLMATLVAAGLPVLRSTARGSVADLESPIHSSEIVALVTRLILGPPVAQDSQSSERTDPQMEAPELPEIFRRLRVVDDAAESGVTWKEMASLLTRAALMTGHISLSQVHEGKFLQSSWHVPKAFQNIYARPCILRSTERGRQLHFTDVFPGDTGFEEARTLNEIGFSNAKGRVMWLVSGTQRTTEFGVLKGDIAQRADDDVSVLETLRAMLIVACLPPDTPAGVRQTASRPAGTGLTRVALDKISQLPRTTAFASRVYYRAQDHLTEFDLSLFTFADSLLRGGSRSVSDSFTVREASRLFASTLLLIAVRERGMSLADAHDISNELQEEIEAAILEGTARKPSSDLARRDLYLFLRLLGDASDSKTMTSLTLGEYWHDVLR